MARILRNDYYRKTYNIDRKYRNTPPVVIIDDQNRVITVNLDKEIRILRLQTAVDNYVNRRWCFRIESTCRTYINLLASSVVGTGLRVKCTKKPEAEEICHKYNKKINASGASMEDLVQYILEDNAVEGFGTWRILRIPEEPYIDLGRLDVSKVMPIVHEAKGWLKFIYKDYYDESVPKTKKAFLSSEHSPTYNEYTKEKDQTGILVEWHIPVESTLHFNLVSRPPMSVAMQYVLFKRWILWFMRKVAEKAWMPPIIGTIGNKDLPLPYGKITADDRTRLLRRYAKRLAKLSSFGIMAKVFGEDIDTLQDKTSVQSREHFVNQIRLLDEQIIFAMGGTLGFTGVEKSEIGESRQKENMLLRQVQALRSRIGTQLENFYINILLPEYGIHLEPGDLVMDWSHLKEDRNLEIIEMASAAMEHGGLSFLEYRKILKSVWDFIEPEDKKHLEDFKKFTEMQAKAKATANPQRPGTATNSMTKKVQGTRPYSQKTGATQKRG